VFTHRDFSPRNALVLFPQDSGDGDVDSLVKVLDWEWAGLFPPHVEWEAGLMSCLSSFLNLVLPPSDELSQLTSVMYFG
jgi:hypothetical protein